MKLRHCVLGLVTVGLIGITGSAWASPAGDAHPSTGESRQTYVLTPGSALYPEWAAWVQQRNALLAQKGDPSPRSDEVGQITIINVVPHSSNAMRVSSLGDGDAPPNNGPVTPLPTTGVEGQQIMVVNQTYTTYQSWIFVWHGTAGSGGGWDSISYSGNFCAAGNETGKLCPRSAF